MLETLDVHFKSPQLNKTCIHNTLLLLPEYNIKNVQVTKHLIQRQSYYHNF